MSEDFTQTYGSKMHLKLQAQHCQRNVYFFSLTLESKTREAPFSNCSHTQESTKLCGTNTSKL